MNILPRIAFLALVFPPMATFAGAPSGTVAALVDVSKPSVPETALLRQQMLGDWYGEAPLKDGGHRKWLVKRKSDGTFRIDFRVLSPGEPVFEIGEVGYWGVAGDVYFTMTRGLVRGKRHVDADVTEPRLYNAYTIIEASDDSFVYRNVETGSKFSLRKVDSSFTFDETP